MCIAEPRLILSVEGIVGHTAEGPVDLSLTPEAAAGDWVLVFLGAARQRIEAEEAARVADALAGLKAVMTGTPADLDLLFADLADREPSLPPHLEAARAAGLREA
ncbi:HypC/HybG/HupF family hydrogenase formation chaperone [Zavarzinia sp.]|uniref:HypC/HybG/HupF family hydrogenase formation chaperone n=1 Tax=Zavarzinia sp. TaxID=2027920 RepID=UPI003561EBAB